MDVPHEYTLICETPVHAVRRPRSRPRGRSALSVSHGVLSTSRSKYQAPVAFAAVKAFGTALLHGRAGRLTDQNGGSAGQETAAIDYHYEIPAAEQCGVQSGDVIGWYHQVGRTAPLCDRSPASCEITQRISGSFF